MLGWLAKLFGTKKEVGVIPPKEAWKILSTIAEDETKRKQAEQYFALPIYPSGRRCWACGDDSVEFEKREVHIVPFHHSFDGRRVLVVTCNRCGAAFYERPQNSLSPDEIPPTPEYVRYEHWDERPQVAVRADLKGRHREYCLCYACARFDPADRSKNCPKANALYQLCVANDMTTPVWECVDFKEQKEGE